MTRIVLTVLDFEKNGCVTLAETLRLRPDAARKFIDSVDWLVADEAEPTHDASFAFILDLQASNRDLVDSGKRRLPLQIAAMLAHDAVFGWLTDRPDPDEAMHRRPRLLNLTQFPFHSGGFQNHHVPHARHPVPILRRNNALI